MLPAYLSLGSNLGDRLGMLRRGLSSLDRLEGVEISAISSLYETSPVGGPPRQPPYLNAVVLAHCVLEPMEMLRSCREIENSTGRIRIERWGARTLDIDILTWGEVRLDGDELVVPHPRLYERLFVLEPLLEIGLVAGCGIDERRARSSAEAIRRRGDQAVVAIWDAGWWKGAAPV